MPKKSCCCVFPRPNVFCCNPIFFTDFITLYGDSLAEHAEVSPEDWIALFVSRPSAQGVNSFYLSFTPAPTDPYSCECVRSDQTCEDFEYYIMNPGSEDNPDAVSDARQNCCQSKYLTTIGEGSKPIFFAYKYSGCNLIWYPREFAFNYDPYVVQCNGFITQNQFSQFKQNSCHNWATQERNGNAGAADPTSESSNCEQPSVIGASTVLPCACSTVPHIHGGIYDALYNRINVKLSPYALGYVPFMLPFSKPMELDEAQCCWCANSTGSNVWEAFLKARASCHLQTYPFADGTGRTISETNVCGPGFDCKNYQNNILTYNPNYRPNCFNRGISPYLLRIAKDDYKMAYEIWGHGSTPEKTNDYGVLYRVTDIQIKKLQKDITLEFRKYTGQKSKLREQFIGTVHLEHHFEMYAYRSDIGSSTIEIQALQNNCTSLISPYETYGGMITKRGPYSRWTPWKYDSILWQVRRAVPRRVIYKGSGVPLFHFDLVNMENISYANEIKYENDYFDGSRFLEHYYRYFYGLIYFSTGGCEYPGDIPNAPEWDFSHYLNSYYYVRNWIEQMIVNGVIKIKDHAIDISQEVNTIIEVGSYEPNGDIVVPEEILTEVGGLSGYKQLINFFGVSAGTQNATNPKIIKNKLLNTDSLSSWDGPSSDKETFRAFLPRRAVLPVSETLNGLTSWGFTGSFAGLSGTSYGITGDPSLVTEAITDLPAIYSFLLSEEDNVFKDVLNPQKVVCGLMATFVVDASGKLTVFGSDELEDPNLTCGSPLDNWPALIGCVPWYLRIETLFKETQPGSAEFEPVPSQDIPDGRVIDVAFKRDFAVALVDFNQNAIGLACSNPNENAPDFVAAFEQSTNLELDEGGPGANVNGNNEFFTTLNRFCSPEEPFNPGRPGIPPVPSGPRSVLERRKLNAYRLKSWGSKSKQYGTFSGSNLQGSITNVGGGACESLEPIFLLRYNSDVNPPIGDDLFSRRYPGTNNSFIWTSIGSGVKHFAAIDDYGGLFITPQSDNSLNQSSKGLGVTYSSWYKQQLEMGVENPDLCDLSLSHNGLGPKFNYFPHIPRPGYVKPEEWTQSFYNNITLFNSNYKKYLCQCYSDDIPCGEQFPPSSSGGGAPCAERIYSLQSGCTAAYPSTVKDLTCVMMGSFVEYDDPANNPQGWIPRENDAQPGYIKVACGHYNTLCLTNENRLEIYGSYVKIDSRGEPIINDSNPIVPAFIPSQLSSTSGTWNVTYGCPIYCQGATHSPIIDYTYTPPSQSQIIKEIKSSADYSICVTSDNRIHIWGDVSMIPGLFDPNNYQSGQVGYRVLDEISGVNQIVAIGAGVNSFYIHYKKDIVTSSNSIPFRVSVTYEFTRYNINGITTEVPDDVQSSRITDIDAGFLHAVAIYNKKLDAKGWNASDFAEDTLQYQFKNFASLPFYFRRQAFFHALPGGWDYSKWLYGSICCNSLENPVGNGTDLGRETDSGRGNPVSRRDTCSALRYNIFNGSQDLNLSYSGNPHLYWMRLDWRRSTYQATDIIQIPDYGFIDDPDVCRPDLGIAINAAGANFSFVSGNVGECLNNYGPSWGTARPLITPVRRDILVATGSECWRIPCSQDYRYVNPLVNSGRRLTAVGAAPLPRIGYRATKDVFQKMTILYGADIPAVGGDINVCPVAKGAAWSYFKYAERHYYLGYDREKDTWEIYENNPDFLRETSEMPFKTSDEGERIRLGLTGCTLYGFGGGVGVSGGTATGCCGGKILSNYPLTGPNYAIENISETPVVIADTSVQNVVNLAISSINNDEFCDTGCLIGIQSSNPERYLGPGGFMFDGGPNYGLSNENTDLAPMLYSHLYNRTIDRTQYVKNMLLGVSTNLATATIPPNQSNTDYTKKSFIDVLRDPNLTEIERPWEFATSKKWIPICWRTPFYLENRNTENLFIRNFYFNYSQNSDLGNNKKILSTDKTQPPRIIEYNLQNLPVIEIGEDPSGRDTIRFVEEFVTNSTTPYSILLQSGLFEFYISCRSQWASNVIYLFAKIFKISQNGTETLIAETLADTAINTEGSLTIPAGGDTPTETSEFRELITSCFVNENIPLELTDRISIKLYVKGGKANPDPLIGDSIYINYQDDSPYTYRDDEGNEVPLPFTKYSRLQYSVLDTNVEVSQPCFSGFSGAPSIIFPSTRQDPNIVRVIYDQETNLIATIEGPPVTCQLIRCCGE